METKRQISKDISIKGRMRTTRPHVEAIPRSKFTLDGFTARSSMATTRRVDFKTAHNHNHSSYKPSKSPKAATKAQITKPIKHTRPAQAKTAVKIPSLPRQTHSSVLKRQFVATKPKKANPKHHGIVPKMLTGMAILLFLIGTYATISSLHTDKTVKAQVKQMEKQADNTTGGTTDGVPSETSPPINVGAYSVAPDMPKLFTIKKLGVNARILPMGVDSKNVLKSPGNIYDVGWYESSAKPGNNGTVFIDGHVSGPTRHGVFYSIKTLVAGDKVQITRGDNKVFTYTVVKTEKYDADNLDMSKVLTSADSSKPGLNFMTCTGQFDARTNKFLQRVAVFTVQD